VIFLDTGFLFAYVSENDEDHARVNEVLEAHRGRRLSDFLLTTNHVVAETITLVSKRGHRDPGVRHDLAVKVGRQLHAGVFGDVHHASAEEELEASTRRGRWARTSHIASPPGPARDRSRGLIVWIQEPDSGGRMRPH